MRIAVIEDNTALANGIAHVLRDQGHAVDVLNDGADGAEFLAQEAADIIVLDINLPRISGLEILQTVRARGDLTPVILLTARGETKDRVAGLDAGADDYLVKPFDMEELDARIRALIRRKPREDGGLKNSAPSPLTKRGDDYWRTGKTWVCRAANWRRLNAFWIGTGRSCRKPRWPIIYMGSAAM